MRSVNTVSAGLLVHRDHGPHDKNLEQVVVCEAARYHDACVALLGCPQDFGVRRNGGRPGADRAPGEIRRQLYRLSAPAGMPEGSLYDAGDVPLARTLEEIHLLQQKRVRQLLADGKRVVVLGGGNDISYPDAAALAAEQADLLVFNIDSHFDVRRAEQRNSGTAYRQLLEEKIIEPARLYQMGSKPGCNGPQYREYLDRLGVNIFTLEQLRRHGVEKSFARILRDRQERAIFWGFDLDAVRAADAPGVSASYPLGFSADEVCRIAALAGRDPRSRLLEISECNPQFDLDGRTAKLAAQLVISFLGGGDG